MLLILVAIIIVIIIAIVQQCTDGQAFLQSITYTSLNTVTGVLVVCVSGRFVSICADEDFDFDAVILQDAVNNACSGGQ